VEGRADLIVSGDEDLLALGNYEGIQVVTPAQFVEMLPPE
jgi:predicted nucleic acid-binding protein